MQNETTNGHTPQAPVVGAWHVQVAFSESHPGIPEHLRGRTENAILLFLPGGVLSAAGPIASAAGGQWQQIDERTYSFFLAEFVFEPGMPPGRLEHAVTHADAIIKLTEAGTSFTLEKAQLQLTAYDPATGHLTSRREIAYSDNEQNPPERIRGRRIASGWQAPDSAQLHITA